MRNIYKSSLIIIVLLSFTFNSYSQFSISYHGFKNHKIGFGLQFSDRVWTEFKLFEVAYTNDYISETYVDNEIAGEVSLNFNLALHKDYNIYCGLNGFYTYDDGYWGLGGILGAEIFPFQTNRNVSFHIQVFPYFDDYNDIKLLNEIGVRYRFHK